MVTVAKMLSNGNTLQQALAPYTTQCVGIDLSEGMVAAYNTRAQNQVSRQLHCISLYSSLPSY